MPELTRDQLRQELINHGVPAPSPNTRKGELQKLYEMYVAPIQKSKGEFSSDEEEDIARQSMKAMESLNDDRLVIGDLIIAALEDDELFSRLQSLGASLGPIVDSTRKVYQKKLYVLMGGTIPDSPLPNGDVDEEYSDHEEPVQEAVRTSAATVQHPVETEAMADVRRRIQLSQEYSQRIVTEPPQRQEVIFSQMTEPSAAELRRRIQTARVSNSEPITSFYDNSQQEVCFDPNLHTPSPRRSLRSVTSTSERINIRQTINNGSSVQYQTNKSQTEIDAVDSHESGKGSPVLRLLIKLLLLALVIIALLYVYQEYSTESPFKAIEDLARSALESAMGGENRVAGRKLAGEEIPQTPDAGAIPAQ